MAMCTYSFKMLDCMCEPDLFIKMAKILGKYTKYKKNYIFSYCNNIYKVIKGYVINFSKSYDHQF